MTAHTAGPWEAIEHPKDWVVKQRITTATETRFPALVARVERASNARLIASAPDLMAALEELIAEWCDDPDDPFWNAARAAIAAAKRETP